MQPYETVSLLSTVTKKKGRHFGGLFLVCGESNPLQMEYAGGISILTIHIHRVTMYFRNGGILWIFS